jgi:hypothetical protein
MRAGGRKNRRGCQRRFCAHPARRLAERLGMVFGCFSVTRREGGHYGVAVLASLTREPLKFGRLPAPSGKIR